MHARLLHLALAVVLLVQPGAAMAGAGDALHATDAPIKRFLRVDARLYRGGQPDAAGYAYLRDVGVRTVVSLRTGDEGERAAVEALGMRFVHIPVALRPFGATVKPDAVARFFQIVDDPSSGIVFVHCKRGADRTGTFVGLYRMARQQWDDDRAYDEARDIGMRWWYFPIRSQLAGWARAIPPAAAPAQ